MKPLPSALKRVLPKVKLKDIDWKWAVLLAFLMFVTIGDDLTGIGELLDVFELPIDVLVAMILSRNSIRRAAERENVTVQGTVVRDGNTAHDATVPEVKRG